MSNPVTGYPAYSYPNVSTSNSISSTSTSITSYPNITPAPDLPNPSAPSLPHLSSSPSPSSTTYNNPYILPPSNQYVHAPPPPHSSDSNSVDSVLKSLDSATRSVSHKFNKIVKHMTAGKSLSETAVGKLHNISLIIPGESEKTWRKHFQTNPTDRLLSFYACLLSTSAGPIPGTLFVSHQNFAFYSDSPVSASATPGVQVQSHYKVLIPVERVSQVNSTFDPRKPEDRYIQVVTIDSNEFWFLGFISYSEALKLMKHVQSSNLRRI